MKHINLRTGIVDLRILQSKKDKQKVLDSSVNREEDSAISAALDELKQLLEETSEQLNSKLDNLEIDLSKKLDMLEQKVVVLKSGLIELTPSRKSTRSRNK